MEQQFRSRRYKGIEEYGAIGNLRTVALVGRDGAIDWCCLPYLDSAAVFGALLDAEKGGRFQVAPARESFDSAQRYVEHTNVLVTDFRTEAGAVELIDCMPLEGDLNGCHRSSARPEIYRLIRGIDGVVEVEVLWAPRFDYGRQIAQFKPLSGGVLARAGRQLLSLSGIPGGIEVHDTPQGPTLRARFEVRAGQRMCVISRWGTQDVGCDLERSLHKIDETVRAWRGWVHKSHDGGGREWAGPYREQVIRSELALKLMSQAGTGALAAAATTSLPEEIGGVRNWDYRYAWLRDAAQISRAFFALGHREEIDHFIDWAEHAPFLYGSPDEEFSIMYPLRPDTSLVEEELTHLEGYRGSGPVRIGNKAARQLQLDIYGELLGAVHERLLLERRFDRDIGPFLRTLAEQTCRRWRSPDFSIWEPRSGAAQHTYSKLMCWVALRRARDLARRGLVRGNSAAWKQTEAKIRRWVLEQGYSENRQSFVQVADGDALDAANLLIPVYGLLPADDVRVQRTIDAVMEELTVNDLVYRYHADDGLPGQEGAFVLCTFWLVDALTLSGRLDEAYQIFESVMSRANHVGLFAEQIDPASGAFLGNFPQAYSHVGVINSTLYLAQAQGRRLPREILEDDFQVPLQPV